MPEIITFYGQNGKKLSGQSVTAMTGTPVFSVAGLPASLGKIRIR